MLPPQWAARSIRISRFLAPLALAPLLLTTAATSHPQQLGAANAGTATAPSESQLLASAIADANQAAARPDQHGSLDDLAPAASASSSHARVHFLVAALSGANEISAATGAANAGDPDGRAVEVLRIQGDQACFATRWANISAPVAHHIHVGAAGVNGAINVVFFSTAIPATINSIAGCVTADATVLQTVVARPAGFYVNLHTADFPAGAARGQLHTLRLPVSLAGFVLQRGRFNLAADGANEVPAADADGQAVVTTRLNNDTGVSQFSEAWRNLGPVVASHIHSGAVGVSGPIVVPFYGGALPAGTFAVAGSVTVAPALAQQINANPAGFYANIHTTEFPPGAVRGQLPHGGPH
jgi:CHRD domain